MAEKIVLENGVRIVFEKIPYLRSAAVGIWVESGSRHETADVNGISHFIEHMVFKGTEKMNAAQIAEKMDAIGGQSNAFTTKEHTCFYIKALDLHLRQGMEILCDIFLDCVFREEDLRLERGVVLEEIGMYEDSPEDLCTERLTMTAFRENSLGRPILGTAETLNIMTGRQLLAYKTEHYRPENIVVSLCGSFSDDDLEYIKERFSDLKGSGKNDRGKASYLPGFTVQKKEIEQNHIAIGFPAFPSDSPNRFTIRLLNGILGGGMSSRLFQKIREQSGLCYSIYSYLSEYFDTGMLSIYAGLARNAETKAVGLIRNEIETFLKEGPSREEIDRVREQVKANVLMGLENTISRMNYLARGELLFGKVDSPDELCANYDAVTRDGMMEVAGKVLDMEKVSFSAVGQVGDEETYKKLFV